MASTYVPVALSVVALLLLTPQPAEAVPIEGVPSTVETTPVANRGDSADDPSIWVHPTDPSLSLVIGNNKGGSLESYDLSGRLVQRITTPSGFYGNVDVRGSYVAVSKGGIRIYTVNPATRRLSLATEGTGTISTSGEGLCMYDQGAPGLADGLYTFVVTRAVGRVRQYSHADADGDGLLTGSLVRDFTVGSESESCVVDDATGTIFISEEDVAIWRYGASPTSGTARTMVAGVSADLVPDIEGLAVAGDYLLASAQNVASPTQNWINIYDRFDPHAYVESIRVVAGPVSDDCDQTDGITAYSGDLGPAFPSGLFVCQDGYNGAPGTSGNQNFKLVPLESVLP